MNVMFYCVGLIFLILLHFPKCFVLSDLSCFLFQTFSPIQLHPGVPKKYIDDLGDPYLEQMEACVRFIIDDLRVCISGSSLHPHRTIQHHHIIRGVSSVICAEADPAYTEVLAQLPVTLGHMTCHTCNMCRMSYV